MHTFPGLNPLALDVVCGGQDDSQLRIHLIKVPQILIMISPIFTFIILRVEQVQSPTRLFFWDLPNSSDDSCPPVTTMLLHHRLGFTTIIKDKDMHAFVEFDLLRARIFEESNFGEGDYAPFESGILFFAIIEISENLDHRLIH